MFTFRNTPTCFYIEEAMTQPIKKSDGTVEHHFFPAIIQAFHEGYTRTDWDYGTDFALAKRAVDEINAERGVNKEAVSLIVATSMFPGSRVTLEDIYRANNEEVPANA